MLRLRAYRREDAQTICGWLADERAFQLWSAGKLKHCPADAHELNCYYGKQDPSCMWGMTAFDEEGTAGHVMMRFLDEKKTDLRLGLIVVDGKRRGKGYGREMVSMAARFAFEFAGAERVSIEVFRENPAALRCYEACGFVPAKDKTPSAYSCMGEQWELVELELTKEK